MMSRFILFEIRLRFQSISLELLHLVPCFPDSRDRCYQTISISMIKHLLCGHIISKIPICISTPQSRKIMFSSPPNSFLAFNSQYCSSNHLLWIQGFVVACSKIAYQWTPEVREGPSSLSSFISVHFRVFLCLIKLF